MTGKKGLGPVRYSTTGLPAEKRHEAWTERGWPSVAALFDSTPIGEFSTSAEDIYLDGIAVSYAFGTARVLERTPERIAADRIDVLGVGVLIEGEMEGTAGAREFEVAPGEMLLFDISCPVTMTMSVSRSVQLAIPRALAEDRLGPIDTLHGVVIPRAEAAAFYDHLMALQASLPNLAAQDAPAAAAALLDVFVHAVRSE